MSPIESAVRLLRERTRSSGALSELSRKVDQQQEEIRRLEDETRAAAELIEDAQLEEADPGDQIERLERQGAWLRDRLRQKGDHEAAFAQLETMEGVEGSARPSNVLDIVAGELPGVNCLESGSPETSGSLPTCRSGTRWVRRPRPSGMPVAR